MPLSLASSYQKRHKKMDYKYIEQLLDLYWRGETTLEQEQILRTFFTQENVPAELRQFQPLFAYQAEETREDVLGSDFDQRLSALMAQEEAAGADRQEPKVVKARKLRLGERLRPLLRAAAVVAVILTLGNAIQVPFQESQGDPISHYDGYTPPTIDRGTSVATADSAAMDTLRQTMLN